MRWSTLAALGFCAALPLGCVAVGEGGYGFDDYYEPYGIYGGWGPDYYVAPFYRDHPRFHEDHFAHHAFRSAPPATHAIPSIPSRGRPGGEGHAGGGRGESGGRGGAGGRGGGSGGGRGGSDRR